MVKKIDLAAPRDPQPDDTGGAPAGLGLTELADEANETLTPGPTTTDGDAIPPPIPAMTNTQCLMMGAQMIRTTLETVAQLKSPAVTMADDKLQPAADALGAVFDKHGWNLQALGGAYMLEISALMTCAPLAYAVYAGCKAEFDARAKPARPVMPTPGPGGSVTEMFPKGDPRNVTLDGKQ